MSRFAWGEVAMLALIGAALLLVGFAFGFLVTTARYHRRLRQMIDRLAAVHREAGKLDAELKQAEAAAVRRAVSREAAFNTHM